MRISLKDLNPNTNYNLQLRSKDADSYSEWSQLFALSTTTDLGTPGAVQSLTANFNQGNLEVSWFPPATTKGIRDYYVTIQEAPANPAQPIRKMYVPQTSFTFTKEENAAVFGTYRSSLIITVQTRDLVGSLGPVASLTKTKATTAAPTGAVWAVAGSSFIGGWETPAGDVRDYEVTITNPAGVVKRYYTSSNRFELTFAENKAAFVTPQHTLTFTVAARDSTGAAGAATAPLTATNAKPAAVTNLTGVAGADEILLKWDRSPSDDILAYKVSLNGSQNLSYFGPNNNYDHFTVAYNTDHTFTVVAVDIFEQSSDPVSVGPLRPKSPFTVDVAPPADPGAPTLVASTVNNAPQVKVTWSPVANTGSDLLGYRVRYAWVNPSGARDWYEFDVAPSAAPTFIATAGLTSGTDGAGGIPYVFQVMAYDASANYSGWSPAATTNTTASGVVVSPNISDERVVVAGGSLRSSDYNATTGFGWKLTNSTFDMQSGNVHARTIKAGELRSNINITDANKGTVGQPLWSLNLDGNMSINDAQVRGKIVVGGPSDTAAQKATHAIVSSNYGGNGAQWSIQGDGTFDIKTGTGTGVRLSGTGLSATRLNANGIPETSFSLGTDGNLSLTGYIKALSGEFTGDIISTARISGGTLAGGNVFGGVYSTSEDTGANQIRIGPNESAYGGNGPALTFGAANSGAVRPYLRYDAVSDNLAIGNPNGSTFAGIELATNGKINFFHRDEFNTDPEGNRLPGMTVDSRGATFYEHIRFSRQTRQQIHLYNETYGIGVQDWTHYFRTNRNFAWYLQGTHSNAEIDPGTGGTRLMRLDENGNLFIRGNINAQATIVEGGGSTGTTINDANYVKLGEVQTITALKNFTGGIQRSGVDIFNRDQNDARYALKGEIPAQQDLSGFLPKSGGTMTGILGLQDVAIRFRGESDGNHYVSFNLASDGLDVVGNMGGRLGTMTGGTFVSRLTWGTSGVNVPSGLTVNGSPVYTVASPPPQIPAASTVAGSTTYGLTAVVGTGTSWARNDHHHGTPPAQVITAGSGISAVLSGVNYTVGNTGVLSLAVTNNASVNSSTGAVTITNSLTPTFTTINTTGNATIGGTLSGVSATFSSNLGVTGLSTLGTLSVTSTSTFTGLATFNGSLTTPQISVSGITGAQNATRYVGATASGAPTTGTFAIGDYVIARDGNVWICTNAGTPGTWRLAGLALGTTVTGATTWGLASNAGSSLTAAKSDHTHGTPATPVTSLTGTAGQIGVSASTGAVTLTNLGILAVATGAGLSSSTVSGTATLTNTGVTSILQGTGITVNSATGAVTVTNAGVTSFAKTSSNLTLSGATGSINLTLTDNPTWTTQTVTGQSSLGPTNVKGIFKVLRADNSTYFQIDPAVSQITFPASSISGDSLIDDTVGYSKLSQATRDLIETSSSGGEVTDEMIISVGVGKLTAGAIVTDDINLGSAGRIYAGASKTAPSRLEFIGGGTDASRGIFAYSGGVNTVKLAADGSFSLQTATTGRRIDIDSAVGIELWNATERTFFADVATGNLSLKGTIVATGGNIGGYTIGATDLNIGGTSATSATISSSAGIYLGGSSTTAPFRVNMAGRLDASNVHITGGDLTIGSSFSVTNAGLLTATGANINGTLTGSVFRTSSTTGDGTVNGAGLYLDSAGFKAFAASNASAVTTIDSATGLLTSSNANISGAITATSGSFNGSVTATGGTIGGFTLGATSLTATNILIDSSLGEISVGTGATQVEMSRTQGLFAGATTAAASPFSVSLAGSLKATLGTVGGFALSATMLNIGGTSTSSISLDSTSGIYVGGTSTGAPFRVSLAGVVNASSGTIGGWDIAGGNLSSAAGTAAASWIQLSPGTGIWAGDTTFAAADFSVSADGALKAISGAIGGFTINGASGLYSGTGLTRVQMQPGSGFWAGADARDSAPFYVTQDGTFKATKGTFSGALSGATGSFSGSLSGATGSFSGTISASSITTRTNTTTNQYGVLDYDNLSFYNTAGTLVGRLYMNGSSLELRPNLTTSTRLYMGSGNGYWAGSDSLSLNGYTHSLNMDAGGIKFNSTPLVNGVYISLSNHDHNYAASSHTHSYAATTHYHTAGEVSGVAASSHTHSYASDTHNHSGTYATPGHSHGFIDNRNSGALATMGLGQDGASTRIYEGTTARFRVTNGKQLNTDITGTVAKAFVIDHPDPAKTDTHYLQHVCIEGPTADVFYRGEAQLTFFQDPNWNADPEFPNPLAGHGAATVELPDYFVHIAKEKGATVMITPILGCDDYDCPFGFGDGEVGDLVAPTLAVSRVKDGKFYVRTTGGYQHGCASFFWEVKAERKDVPGVEVEPSKAEYGVGGDGPYTYLTKKA